MPSGAVRFPASSTSPTSRFMFSRPRSLTTTSITPSCAWARGHSPSRSAPCASRSERKARFTYLPARSSSRRAREVTCTFCSVYCVACSRKGTPRRSSSVCASSSAARKFSWFTIWPLFCTSAALTVTAPGYFPDCVCTARRSSCIVRWRIARLYMGFTHAMAMSSTFPMSRLSIIHFLARTLRSTNRSKPLASSSRLFF